MFFAGVPDEELRELTGSFPKTLRQDKTTHPIFVLKNFQTGIFACPCTSKGIPTKFRFIKFGCQLEEGKQEVMKLTSYLVETCTFTLPLDRRFSRKLIYLGVVPETCIEDRRKPC